MTQIEREEQILDKLNEQEFVLTSELARLFDVTEMTIRRDFESMEKKGMLERIHGGAKRIEQTLKEEKQQEGQWTIETAGKKLASLIPDQSHVFIDGGAVNLSILPYLNHKNLHISTNAPLITSYHDLFSSLVVLGGTYLAKEQETAGPFLLRELNDLYFDYALISCSGVSLENASVFSNCLETAETKKKVIRHSNRSILMTSLDSYEVQTYVRFASIRDFYALYSEEKISFPKRDV